MIEITMEPVTVERAMVKDTVIITMIGAMAEMVIEERVMVTATVEDNTMTDMTVMVTTELAMEEGTLENIQEGAMMVTMTTTEVITMVGIMVTDTVMDMAEVIATADEDMVTDMMEGTVVLVMAIMVTVMVTMDMVTANTPEIPKEGTITELVTVDEDIMPGMMEITIKESTKMRVIVETVVMGRVMRLYTMGSAELVFTTKITLGIVVHTEANTLKDHTERVTTIRAPILVAVRT